MTPGGKVGHRAFAAVVRGNDDGMKRRPVALGQAISGFRLLSTGSGSRWEKRKAASPMEAARSVT